VLDDVNRCRPGGIALSSVSSSYQHGSVFHAGEPDRAGSVRRDHGSLVSRRWLFMIRSGCGQAEGSGSLGRPERPQEE